MAFARTDTLDQRFAILQRLRLRNRLVWVLRIAVPAAGISAFVALVAQITIANMLNHYGVAGIRIDRGKLVVETPQYSGTGPDGTRYVLSARQGQAALNNPNAIEMINATLEYSRPSQPTIHARASNATFDSAAQRVIIPGVVTLKDDAGMSGTLAKVTTDIASQVTIARGPVDLTFGDGTHLVASNMRRDVLAQSWRFDRATLTVPDLPESNLPPIPDFAFHGWVAG